MDDIDSGNVLNAITPVHLENLVQGGSTYGMSEALTYFTGSMETSWLFFADLGLGLGGGIMLTSLLVRLIYLPINIYT